MFGNATIHVRQWCYFYTVKFTLGLKDHVYTLSKVVKTIISYLFNQHTCKSSCIVYVYKKYNYALLTLSYCSLRAETSCCCCFFFSFNQSNIHNSWPCIIFGETNSKLDSFNSNHEFCRPKLDFLTRNLTFATRNSILFNSKDYTW